MTSYSLSIYKRIVVKIIRIYQTRNISVASFIVFRNRELIMLGFCRFCSHLADESPVVFGASPP
jgi:hypothetical protein